MTTRTVRAGVVLAAFAVVALAAGRGTWAQGTAPYFPPAGSWAKKAPAELGMDPALLAEAVKFAESRESTREVDFSDQERIFGSLLGSVPTKRARTNGLVIYKG